MVNVCSSWDLRSSGVLRGVVWQFYVDVSGQPNGPIFKGQEVQKFLTLEDGTDTLSRNVGKGLALDAT
jgi:hypothetical protein